MENVCFLASFSQRYALKSVIVFSIKAEPKVSAYATAFVQRKDILN